MSGYIFYLSVNDDELRKKLQDADQPIGYVVVAETEVKARNAVRRVVTGGSESTEGLAYKKTSKQTDCVVLGEALAGVAQGVFVPDYGDF